MGLYRGYIGDNVKDNGNYCDIVPLSPKPTTSQLSTEERASTCGTCGLQPFQHVPRIPTPLTRGLVAYCPLGSFRDAEGQIRPVKGETGRSGANPQGKLACHLGCRDQGLETPGGKLESCDNE